MTAATLMQADASLASMDVQPFHLPLSGGKAELVAGTLAAMKASHWWLPGPAERVGAVLRGAPLERVAEGFEAMRPYRVAGVSGSAGLRALFAVGLGAASEDARAVVHLSEGSLSDGAFAEALNLASLLHANVVFVVHRRRLEGAPVARQSAADADALARAYAVPSHKVTISGAAEITSVVSGCLTQQGPSLIEAWDAP